MRVSIFVDADPEAAALAAEVGADRIEIYTGPYGGSFDPDARQRELEKVVTTGRAAAAAGIGLNAGHDLTLDNLPPLVAALPNLAEVSIGHALTADALIYGMAEAVRRYRAACGNPVVA
jgi:pyridoxine 5-phosphate synthase